MVWRFVLIVAVLVPSAWAVVVGHPVEAEEFNDARLITVYDRGQTRTFLSKGHTIGEALGEENIELDAHDTVEPAIDQEMVAPEYHVNIYRARPVIVVDGNTRVKTISPYQTAEQIAEDVDINIFDGDVTSLRPLGNFVADGAGLELTIKRATLITLDLYGKKTKIRTVSKTVGEMLIEKGIVLGKNGRVSVSKKAPIKKGMLVRVWREGRQTITKNEKIPYSTRIVYDADRPLGYRKAQVKGVVGIRTISYEINVKQGKEVSREEIANIVTRKPTKQTVVIGLKNNGTGLTEGRGAQYWKDSKGVEHRETYYDLNMSVVMQSCGKGGKYYVRPDGAKVDDEGYILIAANYGNYPKCTLVETSLGLGKVYDTGGFALRHPHGFDIATDWSREDGI